jgi:FMN phosphatase YigB (HAD superfamily)
MLDTPAHQCLHVGDQLGTDIWGAKSAGCWAVQLLTTSPVNDSSGTDIPRTIKPDTTINHLTEIPPLFSS